MSENTTYNKPLLDGSRADEIIDRYSGEYPQHQNAANIFKNDWASRFPEKFGTDSGGHVPLFNDSRIDWMVEEVGGVAGKSILDLGSLEGGHAYSLEMKHDAKQVLGIEANERAFLKCLISKEIAGMSRSKFMLGDVNKYMSELKQPKYDIVSASGILYHMDNPAEHIKLLCNSADTVYVWTHYYDKKLIEQIGSQVIKKFNNESEVTYDGYRHTLYQQDYLEALGWGGFCGAGKAYANWITRNDMYNLFEKYGFSITSTSFETPLHPHGPSFSFIAKRNQN